MSLTIQKSNLIDLENLGLYIDGNWINDCEEGVFEVTNPSNQKVIAKIPKGSTSEAKHAINAASQALTSWRTLTAQERAAYMLKMRDLMLEHKEELALIMSIEMGKVITEARGEVVYAASFLEWYAEEGKRIYGETIPASSKQKRLFVIKQPVGVVAAITPWNFPLAMITRKLGPALTAGCTSVLKPANQTVLSALAFGRIIELAGLPPGVINIVAGSTQNISDEIFDSSVVKKVTFTGSTEVGKELVRKSAQNIQKLSLELGGHAPFIVFSDADIDKAVKGAIASKFRNTGQTCVCANRIYVHKDIEKEFLRKLAHATKKLIVGHSTEENAEVGPLVNEDGLKKVIEHVDDAVSKGAAILCGGELDESKGGYFYKPTILSNVTNEMKITFEETFGPVAPVIPFETDEEVLALANNSEYGLAAYLYTKDISRAITISEELDFGIIGLNDALPSTAQVPFGGIKHSGYGKEGGHQGIQNFLDEKLISLEL